MGELVRVDSQKKTFVVRVDNGMEQTFRFDAKHYSRRTRERPDSGSDASKARKHEQPRRTESEGKEGSEVTVEWRAAGDAKMATQVDVTQVSTSKSQRRGRKKH